MPKLIRNALGVGAFTPRPSLRTRKPFLRASGTLAVGVGVLEGCGVLAMTQSKERG
jgi:hypothetical protein